LSLPAIFFVVNPDNHVLNLDVGVEVDGLQLEPERVAGGRIGDEESVFVDDLGGPPSGPSRSDLVGLDDVLDVEESLTIPGWMWNGDGISILVVGTLFTQKRKSNSPLLSARQPESTRYT
jgi:hypothetical protein